jgi:hypothetical protein
MARSGIASHVKHEAVTAIEAAVQCVKLINHVVVSDYDRHKLRSLMFE